MSREHGGGREAGQAAGGAALNLIDRLTLGADGLTGGRRRESEAAPGDAENWRVRSRGRRTVGALNEAPAPLSPEPGAVPARWTVSPAASMIVFLLQVPLTFKTASQLLSHEFNNKKMKSLC